MGEYTAYEYWQMNPSKIDWTGMNVVAHFAMEARADGSLDDSLQMYPANMAEITTLAHQHGAKAVMVLGGAGSGYTLGPVTSDDAKRATLVKNLVSTVQTYGYDGIDVDWEPLQDKDAPDFQALVRDLRAALPAGKWLIADGGYVHFYDFGPKLTLSMVVQIKDQLDYVNLQGYAMSGPWPGWVSWHHSALDNGGKTFPNSTKPLPSVKVMVKEWTDAGVPPSKLILGLAFFGLPWTGGGVTDPLQTWTTAPSLGNEYQYWSIVTRPDFTQHLKRDPIADIPYLSLPSTDPSQTQFLPFDDAASLAKKVDFAADHGLAGVMMWELRCGYLPDGSQPLFDAVASEVRARFGPALRWTAP